MFTWKTSASVEAEATPEAVWALWSAPESWSRWDAGIEDCRLDGAFEAGATGTLKPEGGPRVRFRLTEVEPRSGFADLTRIAFTDLEFRHRVEPLGGGRVRITHQATLRGPLTPLLSRTLGKDLARGRPETVRSLAAMAAGS